MTDNHMEWARSRDELIAAVKKLGFPEDLGLQIAKELGSRGVRVNAIAPGFILTDMTKVLSEETLKQFVSLIPMRRGGEPEEVAKVALFLASDLSSYVSGQVIQVNGAMA